MRMLHQRQRNNQFIVQFRNIMKRSKNLVRKQFSVGKIEVFFHQPSSKMGVVAGVIVNFSTKYLKEVHQISRFQFQRSRQWILKDHFWWRVARSECLSSPNVFAVFPDVDIDTRGRFVWHKGKGEMIGSTSWCGKDAGVDVHGPTNVETFHLKCDNWVFAAKVPIFLDVEVDWGPF